MKGARSSTFLPPYVRSSASRKGSPALARRHSFSGCCRSFPLSAFLPARESLLPARAVAGVIPAVDRSPALERALGPLFSSAPAVPQREPHPRLERYTAGLPGPPEYHPAHAVSLRLRARFDIACPCFSASPGSTGLSWVKRSGAASGVLLAP